MMPARACGPPRSAGGRPPHPPSREGGPDLPSSGGRRRPGRPRADPPRRPAGQERRCPAGRGSSPEPFCRAVERRIRPRCPPSSRGAASAPCALLRLLAPPPELRPGGLGAGMRAASGPGPCAPHAPDPQPMLKSAPPCAPAGLWSSSVMTSPLHGEGPGFDSPRAHSADRQGEQHFLCRAAWIFSWGGQGAGTTEARAAATGRHRRRPPWTTRRSSRG